MKQHTSTKTLNQPEEARSWHIIDAKDKVLGRISPEIAHLLQGKHKTSFSYNVDSGDYVVVINAREVELTGRKEQTKVYQRYSGFPGGLKETSYAEMMKKNPDEVVRRAVSGMLPKNKLRDRRLARLFIYPGADHPHADKIGK